MKRPPPHALVVISAEKIGLLLKIKMGLAGRARRLVVANRCIAYSIHIPITPGRSHGHDVDCALQGSIPRNTPVSFVQAIAVCELLFNMTTNTSCLGLRFQWLTARFPCF